MKGMNILFQKSRTYNTITAAADTLYRWTGGGTHNYIESVEKDALDVAKREFRYYEYINNEDPLKHSEGKYFILMLEKRYPILNSKIKFSNGKIVLRRRRRCTPGNEYEEYSLVRKLNNKYNFK